MDEIFFLDAQTDDLMYRLTAFDESIMSLVKEYREWIKQNALNPNNILYADIFSNIGPKHIAKLKLKEDGTIEVHNAYNSKLNPYKRKLGLRPHVNKLLYRFGLRIEF